MVDEAIEALTGLLLPWLPMLALVLFPPAALLGPFPRAGTRRHLRQRRALERRIEAWPPTATTLEVRWRDHAAVPKAEIADLLGRRGWYYAGQTMTADGWPLRFTRHRSAGVPVRLVSAVADPRPFATTPTGASSGPSRADAWGAVAGLLIIFGFAWILGAVAFTDEGALDWIVFLLSAGVGAVLTVHVSRLHRQAGRRTDR